MGNTETTESRAAGILMHITSLPGPAYIGDIGPEAVKFADFLFRSNQTCWQLLPLQPVNAEQGWSPYSSSSAVAGNPLLISPELLAAEGLIDQNDIRQKRNADKTDYIKAKQYKDTLLDKAFNRWKERKTEERPAFEEFCDKEKYWLDDFALFCVLKNINDNAPWYEWPAELKNREESSIRIAKEQYADELEKIKWIQMVFDRQWTSLKNYCKALQIELLGDVPFYVAHDSADVWCNREYFTVDDNGALTDVAGVPPDLFNDDGQLWGMPLFNWKALKENNYNWWLLRLKKNLQYVDKLRLDHFRAFSSYWKVPATESTAKNGIWEKGPSSDFLKKIHEELGGLPFIAEDLGDIDQPVFDLRDEHRLPGMNVLQFAFGDDMPQSAYLPHNHSRNSVTYTGTHDNNTTLGWFKELKKTYRKNISEYFGMKITQKNVAAQFCRLAYMSPSQLTILPIQDALGLGEEARMNMPASAEGNWAWRLRNDQISPDLEKLLNNLSFYYGRTRE